MQSDFVTMFNSNTCIETNLLDDVLLLWPFMMLTSKEKIMERKKQRKKGREKL